MPRLRRSTDLSCPRRVLAHGNRIRNAVAYLQCVMYEVRFGEFGCYASNFSAEIIVKKCHEDEKKTCQADRKW